MKYETILAFCFRQPPGALYQRAKFIFTPLH